MLARCGSSLALPSPRHCRSPRSGGWRSRGCRQHVDEEASAARVERAMAVVAAHEVETDAEGLVCRHRPRTDLVRAVVEVVDDKPVAHVYLQIAGKDRNDAT